MSQEIKYVGLYDVPSSGRGRAMALAAVNKMDYIRSALNRAGYDVHLVSPSWCDDLDPRSPYQHQQEIRLDERTRLTLCASIGTAHKIARYLKILATLFWLFWWLLIHVKRGETIVVYHSPWLAPPIRLAKSLKRFKLILEVEEVYADISALVPYFVTLEKKLVRSADGFLFSTQLLADKLALGRPYVIVHGVYTASEKFSSPAQDGKIHLLYAGIIDSHKGGAFNAIECLPYLGERYVLHIIGSGDVQRLEIRIKELNAHLPGRVEFDGMKAGRDFVGYCQGCHIGLSTQKMNGKYLGTSFPSKILAYLSMGLRVVSGRIESVVDSKIGHLVQYYEEDTPESIARAIKAIDLGTRFDVAQVLSCLDRDFVGSLAGLVDDMPSVSTHQPV